jgi:hypothetical protein
MVGSKKQDTYGPDQGGQKSKTYLQSKLISRSKRAGGVAQILELLLASTKLEFKL